MYRAGVVKSTWGPIRLRRVCDGQKAGHTRGHLLLSEATMSKTTSRKLVRSFNGMFQLGWLTTNDEGVKTVYKSGCDGISVWGARNFRQAYELCNPV